MTAQQTSDGWRIITSTVPKDPDSIVDYGLDWADWLTGGETITASSWPSLGDLTNESDSFTTTATAIFISGGVAGATYTLTNRITTSAGRVEDRSIKISCREK